MDSIPITCYIRDQSFVINVGPGTQTIAWLTDVVLFKYQKANFEDLNCRGVKFQNKLVDMNAQIKDVLPPNSEIYVLLEGDEEVDQVFGEV